VSRLTRDEIEERKRALQDASVERLVERADLAHQRSESFRYVKPFSDAYDGVVHSIRAADGRFTLGLAEIDTLTRGFGPKELVMILGFSHAGKTQLVNTAILNNRDKRILFLSMDDPTEMILVKLACMDMGVSADRLERQIRQGDESALRALRVAATDSFRNLVVVDESLSLSGVQSAVEEVTSYWGAPPDACIIDYLGSMQSEVNDDYDGVKSKAAALKRWEKEQPFPTIVLHQNTRGRGAPGEPITMLSGAYGGEQEATVLMGIRRKRDWTDLEQWERDQHANSVTLHVVKNKRPPSKVTPYEGVDFYMNPDTGLIRRMHDDDWPKRPSASGQVLTSAHEALEAAKGVSNGSGD
jgi:replicative DNA helicase